MFCFISLSSFAIKTPFKSSVENDHTSYPQAPQLFMFAKFLICVLFVNLLVLAMFFICWVMCWPNVKPQDYSSGCGGERYRRAGGGE